MGQGLAVLHGAAALPVGNVASSEHTGLCQSLARCLLFMLFTLTARSQGFATVQFHPYEHPFGTMNVLSQVDILLAALGSLGS